jgi:hypothetical protein
VLSETVEKFFGMYILRARVFPALLALLPVWITCAFVFHAKFDLSTAGMGSLLSLCALAMLGSIARSLGKRQEGQLYKKWGGKPSTVFLRHRDTNLDPVTKARYHTFLSKKIARPFPSSEEERDNPVAADQMYASGVSWLLEQTRDRSRFSLLFAENVHYGFCRNSFALRPYAIWMASACLLVVAASQGFNVHDWRAWLRSFPAEAMGGGIAILVALGGWAYLVKEVMVRQAAEAYAQALLRACDTLAKPGR